MPSLTALADTAFEPIVVWVRKVQPRDRAFSSPPHLIYQAQDSLGQRRGMPNVVLAHSHASKHTTRRTFSNCQEGHHDPWESTSSPHCGYLQKCHRLCCLGQSMLSSVDTESNQADPLALVASNTWHGNFPSPPGSFHPKHQNRNEQGFVDRNCHQREVSPEHY